MGVAGRMGGSTSKKVQHKKEHCEVKAFGTYGFAIGIL